MGRGTDVGRKKPAGRTRWTPEPSRPPRGSGQRPGNPDRSRPPLLRQVQWPLGKRSLSSGGGSLRSPRRWALRWAAAVAPPRGAGGGDRPAQTRSRHCWGNRTVSPSRPLSAVRQQTRSPPPRIGTAAHPPSVGGSASFPPLPLPPASSALPPPRSPAPSPSSSPLRRAPRRRGHGEPALFRQPLR